MDAPKISVLIPMYNRKHYIADAIDSVLNQTFQDFEIIVRDNFSTDGSFEFVAEHYAAQIAAGKLRLLRNKRNLGEEKNVKRLFLDATGKYFAVLHSDDMYLPDALKHLYEVSEIYNADVVHTIQYLQSLPDGVIEKGSPLGIISLEKNKVDKVTVMPNDQFSRFVEFVESSLAFGDIQHTFFRKDFVFDNSLLIETRCNSLWWLLLAKVYVKSPKLCYIKRDSSDADSRKDATTNPTVFSMDRFESNLSKLIEQGAFFDKYSNDFNIFKENPEFGYIAKAKFFNVMTNHFIKGRNYYAADHVPEDVRKSVEKIFKKYFGMNASYPIFLFHLINFLPYIPGFERVFIPTPPPTQHEQ